MSIEFKKDHLIDETKLDRNEAKHFIAFLEAEKYRHVLAMNDADGNRYIFRNITILQQCYNSCVLRHLEDITMIQKSINYLYNKFNLTSFDIMGA